MLMTSFFFKNRKIHSASTSFASAPSDLSDPIGHGTHVAGVIAESTPGPIAINCATYVGYKKGKLPGAILATLGVAIPSFIIIFAISMFLEGFLEITWVARAFQGIKMAVGILILDAALKMIKKMKMKPLQMGILLASFFIIMLTNVLKLHLSSIVVMLTAVLVSVAFFLVEKGHGKEGQA